MPTEEVLQLISGTIQILAAVVIFFTLYRRGKNQSLKFLGLFLIIIGLLNLISFSAERSHVFTGSSWFEFYVHIVYHVAVFFGLAGYITAQTSIFNRPMLTRTVLGISGFMALILVIVHVTTMELLVLPKGVMAVLQNLDNFSMLAYFVVSLGFASLFLLFLLFRILKQKKGRMDYLTTVWTGINIMLASLMMKTALDTIPNIPHVDFLLATSLIMIVSGFLLQISFTVLPGIVYDTKTGKSIPLALIHVFDKKQQKVVESTVSGDGGHYNLLLQPGEYELRVKAQGHTFPSVCKDIYCGETIILKRPTVLGIDIAVDAE